MYFSNLYPSLENYTITAYGPMSSEFFWLEKQPTLPNTYALETVQDFLIKLNIKPIMHLVKISIFSLNLVIIRPTKIMNRADKSWAHFVVSLRVTLFSEKMLISTRCIHGFMSSMIKKSWTLSTLYSIITQF